MAELTDGFVVLAELKDTHFRIYFIINDWSPWTIILLFFRSCYKYLMIYLFRTRLLIKHHLWSFRLFESVLLQYYQLDELPLLSVLLLQSQLPGCLRSGLSLFICWISFAPDCQCCYFSESTCLFYLRFNFHFYVSRIMHF